MTTQPASSHALQTSRIIGDRVGAAGPTVVVIGGIHGNEPSGVMALKQVFQQLAENHTPIRGRILGLAGNLPALAEKKRFISQDLNRLWDRDFTSRFKARHAQHLSGETNGQVAEHREQNELFGIIEPLLHLDSPLYFLDLHTTSSDSEPFIAINDQLNNRNFAMKFPVNTVLGIEEYIDGPLLSYLNDFGHVALAFEAGQHNAPESVDLHVAFIYLAMVAANIVEPADIPDFSRYQRGIQPDDRRKRGIFEVIFRKAIDDQDGFQMRPGFRNFDTLSKGELLADDRTGPLTASRSGRIFMPLYQKSGNDGYFIVRRVPYWALRLSSVLRKINFEKFLTLLPGVSRDPRYPDALIVDQRIAFLLATELFHLLGYRRMKVDGKTLIFSRREIQLP